MAIVVFRVNVSICIAFGITYLLQIFKAIMTACVLAVKPLVAEGNYCLFAEELSSYIVIKIMFWMLKLPVSLPQ